MSVVLQHERADAAAARRRRYHLCWLATAVIVLGVALVCQVPDTAVTLAGTATVLPEICLAKRFFGLECPGCGLTRSFICLAHGDVVRAWQFNPAGLLCFAALVWQIPYRAVQLYWLRRGRELTVRHGFGEGVLVVLMVACLIQYVARHAARLL